MTLKKRKHLIITSIADSNHPVLRQYAAESASHQLEFIVVGDKKSPDTFDLPGCDFFSIERQEKQPFSLAKNLPYNHYARKNIGYLAAMMNNSERILETDDDNLPLPEFWTEKERMVNAHHLVDCGWVNVYRYFSDLNIWPRGFSLEHLLESIPVLDEKEIVDCPIHQGLATKNPDVDAIYRLTQHLPVEFNHADSLALGRNSFCPFNSQNTLWFKDAFALMYLPSYCSFRMTDIWRSFIVQRVAWECDWNILFHHSTVWQERNEHNLLQDFKDEVPGYLHNDMIFKELGKLKLERARGHLVDNMLACYQKLIDLELIGSQEMPLLKAWFDDLGAIGVI